MKLKDVVYEELRHILSGIIGMTDNKVRLFRELIDKNGDGIKSSGSPRELDDEIQGDGVPSLSRGF